MDAALDRADAYREAGADILFVEAPSSREELQIVGRRLDAPVVANMVEGGITPIVDREQLARWGYSIILYANAALRAAQRNVTIVLEKLLQEGSTLGAERTDRHLGRTPGCRRQGPLRRVGGAVQVVTADEGTYDLRLSGGTVVLPGTGRSAVDVLVRDGRVAALVAADDPAPASRVLDCRGRVVLPGAVDAHVHLGPNITYPQGEGDALPESRAAAAGGVTSLLAYLMSPQPYDEVFPTAKQAMTDHSLVNFGFHFCVVSQEQLDNLPHYIGDLGVSSFKFFMNFRGDEGAYLGLPGNDDGFLFDLMHAVAENGGMVDPHAENVELVWRLRRLGVKPRCNRPGDVVQRPPRLRGDRGAAAGCLLRRTRRRERLCGAHHGRIRPGRPSPRPRAYSGVFVETCPHYLTLDVNAPCGTYGKVNPPLRYGADREALWAGVASGDVDVIGSDHVPRHRSFKEKDIQSASAGFPGLQNLLPLAISEGHQRRGIPLERIVEVTATRPAELFGLGARKGAITIGADADFAVVDLSTPSRITAATQHSAAEYTPWEGLGRRAVPSPRPSWAGASCTRTVSWPRTRAAPTLSGPRSGRAALGAGQ